MKKIFINILAILTCVCLLTACGSKSADTSDTTADSTNSTSQTVKDEASTDNNTAAVYKTAYASYITLLESVEENADNYTYGLIYVDDDDTPELFINSNVDALGTRIVTIQNGEGNEIELSSSVEYIERSGLIRTFGGSMDNYTMHIYKLQNGGFDTLATGSVSLSDEALKATSEDGEYAWTYTLDGKETTEEEYNGYVNSIFEIGSGITPEANYTSSEMLALLTE